MFGRKKKQQEFAALAASWGMSYAPKDEFGIREWPFDLITARWIRNVVWGPWRGRNLTAFDYDQIISTRGGKGAQVHKYTCVFGATDQQLPKLRIEGHGGYADWILGKPKELTASPTGDETFDARVRVLSADPAFAGKVVTPKFQQWMSSLGHDVAFEASERGVLLSRGRVHPTALPAMLDATTEFLDGLPER